MLLLELHTDVLGCGAGSGIVISGGALSQDYLPSG